MNVRFACPVCDYPGGRLDLASAGEWRCPACDHVVAASPPEPHLPACALCGCADLYKKKDFPHGLGMGILVAALVASSVTYLLYLKWLTWTILLGSALFDGLLYLWVKDVVVCYRCGAHHRGVKSEPFQPHDLGTAERYRQERIRRDQLQAEKKPTT